MRLVVVSHKVCWPVADSSSGYGTDGGFPFQMRALSELFDATTLVVPCGEPRDSMGTVRLEGHRLSVVPLRIPEGKDFARKIRLPAWMAGNLPTVVREIRRADAVHAPIPGDVGTFGLLAALAMKKPLFVRHCGNWLVQRTTAERGWRRLLERIAGGQNVVLATGGTEAPPSIKNPSIQWIFSTSLTDRELQERGRVRELPRRGPIRLAIVCRQEIEKGTGPLLRSLPSVLRSGTDVYLDVVGDGGALQSFREIAHECGVDDRVTFHGKLDHDGVMRVLDGAHLFCYPTAASEGFPKVVLEALGCGLPVLTTRVSVLPILIGAGCGRLLQHASPDSVATGIQAMLEDPNAYEAMSRRAIEVAGQYSLEGWRDRIGTELKASWGRSLRSNG
jgi:hypothetical protein